MLKVLFAHSQENCREKKKRVFCLQKGFSSGWGFFIDFDWMMGTSSSKVKKEEGCFSEEMGVEVEAEEQKQAQKSCVLLLCSLAALCPALLQGNWKAQVVLKAEV